MKKKLCLLLVGVMTIGMLSGCGQSAPAKSDETAANAGDVGTEETASKQEEADGADSGAQPAGEAVVITAWHDNDEAMMNALADVVNEALADQNITLQFEKKSDVTGQIKLYGTDAANGPDMYLFAHDSLGSFAEMGILEPVGNLIS